MQEQYNAVVALCEEGVDRNALDLRHTFMQLPSPSAKRAWIEISLYVVQDGGGASPSAKRAWIEIQQNGGGLMSTYVALCEEGVDRNFESM